jgi:tetratricopeptide (TPR) repeat protein
MAGLRQGCNGRLHHGWYRYTGFQSGIIVVTTEITRTELKSLLRQEGERFGSLACRRRIIEVILVLIPCSIWGFWACSGVGIDYALAVLLTAVVLLVISVLTVGTVPVRRANRALRTGQLDRSKALVRQSMRFNLALFPLTFWPTIYAFDVQIRLLLSQSRFVEVEALASVLLVAYRRFRIFNVGRSIELMLRNYIALAYLGQARFLDAEGLFAECLEGTRHRIARTVLMNNVAYCQLELGNIEEAYRLLSTAAAEAKQRTQTEKLVFLAVNSNLARACVKKSLLDEAGQRIERGIELAESAKAPVSQVGNCYEAFGELRFAQDRYEEAEHHFRNSIDMMQTVLSETHPTVIRVTTRLAHVLEKVGKTKEASDLFIKTAINEEALHKHIKESADSICDTASHERLPLTMV